MIFISTGIISLPFSRLIDQIIKLYLNQPTTKIIIQSGSYKISSPAKHIHIKPYFPLNTMIKHYQTAETVISAAGEASIFLILHYAKNKPIFIPRQKKFHEHIDNQQLIMAQYLKNHHLAHIVTDINQLNLSLKLKIQKNRKNKKIISSQAPNYLIQQLNIITKSLPLLAPKKLS